MNSRGFNLGHLGAEIGHNTAVIKPFWIKVRRRPKGAPFDTVIPVNGMQLANPSGMIWECLTDTQWGMGTAAALLDASSFTQAATTLHNEGFGLAALWHRQETIEEFVGVILDHIEASLALDPFTGLLRLKLIRGDYDVETLPVFGPHNATLVSFERKSWGETINEINVSWTNPANEQTEVVTVHDTANIGLQGGHIVSETRDYFAVRTADLALRLATRDLQVAASSLASCELRVNRSAWRVLPGDVIALSWPEYSIEKIPMRVGHVDYGRPGDSEITLTLVEDVFGMPQQSYVSSDGTAWVNPAIEPLPLAHQHVVSAPYFALAQAIGDTAAANVDPDSDIELVFGTHPASGVQGFEMAERLPDVNGDLEWAGRGSVGPAGRALLPAALPRETVSLVPGFDDAAQIGNAVPGALAWIGPVDATGELAVIRSVDGSGYTLTRGVLDTVPKEWPGGTPIWFLHGGTLGSTGDERLVGETVTLRLLTRTALGVLEVDQASNVTGQMTGRLHRPYRPANLRAGGFLWPDAGWYPDYPVTVTWAGRNRLEETTLINRWDDGHVTPEDGTEYRVRVEAIQDDGSVDGLVEEVVVPGTTYSLQEQSIPAHLAGSPYMRVSVWALRDGTQSWVAASIRFRGPFRAPTNLFAVYKEPVAPTNFNVFILPSE